MSEPARSLRARIVLPLFGVTFLVFLSVELFIARQSWEALEKSLNRALLALAEGLAMATEVEPHGHVELDFSDEIMRDFSGTNPRAYFTVIQAHTSSVLERSRSLKGASLPLSTSLEGITRERPEYWDARIGDVSIRCIALREFARRESEEHGEEHREEHAEAEESSAGGIRDDVECLFVVAMERGETDRRFWELVKQTSVALAAGLVILLLLAWSVVARGLRPLAELGRDVQGLSPSNLTQVPVPDVMEVGHVVQKLNHVIENLRAAFERERRFTADVAHELRTPISEIRSLTEVALKWESIDEGENRRNYTDILEAAQHMQSIVSRLLMLSRCDAGTLQCRQESVDLDRLIAQTWTQVASQAASKDITVRDTVPAESTVVTDPDLFETILENVFSNAVAYTPEGGTIEFGVSRDGSRFSFTIANTVHDLSQDDLPHLLERFWRKDEVRGFESSHCGLGLSLVDALATELGLAVSVRLSPSAVLTIELQGESE